MTNTMTIRNWLTNAVIWEGDAETMVDAIKQALTAGKSLRYADLTDANLTRANLIGANLIGANLIGANLIGANLTRADTALAQSDIRSILTAAPHEVAALKKALLEGRIDGSTYSGPCACLIGTIAQTRHCDAHELVETHPELAARAWRPAERWFLGIREGQTPENHPIAALTLAWIERWEADARVIALTYGSK